MSRTKSTKVHELSTHQASSNFCRKEPRPGQVRLSNKSSTRGRADNPARFRFNDGPAFMGCAAWKTAANLNRVPSHRKETGRDVPSAPRNVSQLLIRASLGGRGCSIAGHAPLMAGFGRGSAVQKTTSGFPFRYQGKGVEYEKPQAHVPGSVDSSGFGARRRECSRGRFATDGAGTPSAARRTSLADGCNSNSARAPREPWAKTTSSSKESTDTASHATSRAPPNSALMRRRRKSFRICAQPRRLPRRETTSIAGRQTPVERRLWLHPGRELQL